MGKHLSLAIVLLANFLAGFTQSFRREAHQGTPIVLRGTIVTPEGIIKHGYVAITNGRISSVSDKQPEIPGAIDINTHGIILPGLVDVHNHLAYNVLPRWNPGRLFTNRNQWRSDPDYKRIIANPVDKLSDSHFCDMNTWAELRALVGGTTSIMTTRSNPCIHGLVRNLDLNSGFYGTTELDREHIYNVLDLPPVDSPSARAFFVAAARLNFIPNPFYEALVIHLAEGTDAAAEEEFTFVRTRSILNPKGAIIHGIPLTSADFQAMAINGTALVWSPRSNLELYGKTANINAALDEGVEVALAPDWSVTGSINILHELKVASQWNNTHLAGRLTDRQLVNMITSIPAHVAGIDDEVGAIRPGLRADILVINGDHNAPYRAVIDATEADVGLVLINGVPLYGDRTFMEHFWKRSELEEINLSGVTKTLATPAANIDITAIENRLRRSMDSVGVSLAPLTEPDPFLLLTSTVVRTNSLEEQPTHQRESIVTVLPNPSRRQFVLTTRGDSKKPLQIKIVDALGRIVEVKNRIDANSTTTFGDNFRPGIYLIEVRQGTERQMVKLIRQ